MGNRPYHGGRSHRRTLVDGILRAGHDIVFLQADRDLTEAGHDLTAGYTWDGGLPEIDALFLRVTGKWTRAAAWPQVNFTGRCPFPEVDRLYRSALATVC